MTDRAQQCFEEWKKERPDLDPFPMKLMGHLGEVVQRVERDYLNPLFSRFGLRPGEFDVLATLRRSGTPYALTPTQLYDALMTSSGGMTNRIDRLEAAGLVQRQSNPADRRGTLVALTKTGLELIETLIVQHVDNERQLLSTLSDAEQRQLDTLLVKLANGLRNRRP
ncbi:MULTISPECIES: MarR family transcriptional regulator [unclassified Brenneria]|uniref:MarR family winged helix-turn-helix transcriptional regulator n=1 Tax=unclassified Brenneria TaxID=2634434 RepID=UPI0029C40666|nr:MULTISPECIES: MarR family transcriptional regulator [unclassified Brenneria]MDX5627299.1 MarR family transcriptional regulator [Brenneria sp. L3-3Z]MDX5694545.1 MarR family transcriptional regulator [Brenneria sp. L4-2C]MEE3661846.1 MarR family transcriptional regulator [Brenneria sp. g21c3]